MNWRLVELEAALIAAIVLVACYCRWDESCCIIYFFMAMIIAAPIVCWVYSERVMYLKCKEKKEECLQMQADRKHSVEISTILKNIDELKQKNDALEVECKKLKTEIEPMKTH